MFSLRAMGWTPRVTPGAEHPLGSSAASVARLESLARGASTAQTSWYYR